MLLAEAQILGALIRSNVLVNTLTPMKFISRYTVMVLVTALIQAGCFYAFPSFFTGLFAGFGWFLFGYMLYKDYKFYKKFGIRLP